MPLQQLLVRVLPTFDQLPREVWLLVIGRAVNRLGAFTLPFLTVALTLRFDASVSAAGALMAVFGAASIASRLAGGWLADRIGRRNTIVTGLCLTAAAQLGLAGAPTLAGAAISVAVLGLAFEIYEPPSQALVVDLVPVGARPAAFGLMSAALSAAAVAAGLLATAVGNLDIRLLFVIDAGTCLGCAVLLHAALSDRASASPVLAVDGSAADGRPVASPWRDARLLALLGCGLVFASVYLQLSATLGLTLETRGIPPARVGLLLTVSALTLVVGQPLLRRGWLARANPWSAMSLGYVVLGAGLLANGYVTTLPQFAAATVLWSLGDLLLLGRAYGLVADIAPEHARARYFSVYGLCWGAAAVIGPAAGTQLLAHVGPRCLWVGCGAACGALAAAQLVLRRRVSTGRAAPPD